MSQRKATTRVHTWGFSCIVSGKDVTDRGTADLNGKKCSLIYRYGYGINNDRNKLWERKKETKITY